ncbi:MAG: ABC transporter permease subunit, partial [Geminicoccaceae bacterium]|nr:ABC transporter permease subunit [Geminicoccaceae bacterium]
MTERVQDSVGTKPPHPLQDVWADFRRNRGAMVGLALIVVITLIAVFANVVAPYGPAEQFRDAFLSPPSWLEGGDPRFLLGTDDVGRDILSRLIYGARLSLLIGVVVVTLALAVGVTLGLVAGFFGGLVDIVVMRIMDIMLALPALLLAIVIVAILGPGLMNAMVAVTVVVVPHYARLTRGAVLSELGR